MNRLQLTQLRDDVTFVRKELRLLSGLNYKTVKEQLDVKLAAMEALLARMVRDMR